ncbi:MAG: methyltransferase domain-containing protein [bacterium]
MAHSGIALLNPHLVFEKIDLRPGMRVADLGCGRTGHFVFPAASMVGEEGIVYAVDIVKNILESIKSTASSQGYDNIQTTWSNIEMPGKVPIPENSLDSCFFVNVLSQIKERQIAIKEATRLLKESGFLVIIDWGKKLGLLGPELGQEVNPSDFINMAKQAGLDLVEQGDMNEYLYLLIFKKI